MKRARVILLILGVGLLAFGGRAMFLSTSHETELPPPPESFGAESDAELNANYRSVDVFTLTQPEGEFKALVFKLPKINDADSDYRIAFYKRSGGIFVRHGAEANLLNFSKPSLSQGPERRVETTQNGLGVKYHFIVGANGAEMVPSEGYRQDGSLVGHPPVTSPR